MDYGKIIARHERVALQFSGGKDSLAVLHLLKPYWDKLTVYYCNPGDPFPETTKQMEDVSKLVPNFSYIEGRRREVAKVYGRPTDILPVGNSYYGRNFAGDGGLPMLDRYSCCSMSFMEPLHERMVLDGVTLIIRGQRNEDKNKSPIRSGMKMMGFEFMFPIEAWSEEDVFKFLNDNQIELPEFYKAGMKSAPDCMGCTAWLEHGLPNYLKEKHPAKYVVVRGQIESIARAVFPHVAAMLDVIRTGVPN